MTRIVAWLLAVLLGTAVVMAVVVLAGRPAMAGFGSEKTAVRVVVPSSNDMAASGTYIGGGLILSARHNSENKPFEVQILSGERFKILSVEWICGDCDLITFRVDPKINDKVAPAILDCRLPRRLEEVEYTGEPQIWVDGTFLSFRGNVINPVLHEDGLFSLNVFSNNGGSGSGVHDSQGRVIGVVNSLVALTFLGVPGSAIPMPIVNAVSITKYCDKDRDDADRDHR